MKAFLNRLSRGLSKKPKDKDSSIARDDSDTNTFRSFNDSNAYSPNTTPPTFHRKEFFQLPPLPTLPSTSLSQFPPLPEWPPTRLSQHPPFPEWSPPQLSQSRLVHHFPAQTTHGEDMPSSATSGAASSHPVFVPTSNIINAQSTRTDSASQVSKPGRAMTTPISLTPNDMASSTARDVSLLQSSQEAQNQHSRMALLDLTPYIVRLEDQYSDGGSFGDVFRCLYRSPTGDTEVQVAVKAFRFRFTLEKHDLNPKVSHTIKMVRRELGIWRRLDHPNIVPFLGAATGFGMQGSLALVSVWMPNGSLHIFLEKHGELLQVAHQLQLLSDIVSGLDYLHSFPGCPIVHGDLNANNVLVDEFFTARLVDFGYSTVVGNIPEALTYLQRSTARPGALRWSAPELILAEEDEIPERTPKSDIYSFGCLSLQVLSGKQPWSELREEGAIAVRVARGEKPKRPKSRVVDDRYWEFIQACWYSAEERPTAAKLATVLQEFMSTCTQSPTLRDMLPS